MSAEEFWIKKAQAQAYSDDLTQLAAGKEVHCSSDLSDWFGQQSSPCERKFGLLIHWLLKDLFNNGPQH